MLAIRPLRLEDRALVRRYLEDRPPEISELTFSNLYVWRRPRPLFLAERNGSLLFLAACQEPGRYLLFGPPAGPMGADQLATLLGAEIAGCLRLTSSWAEALAALGGFEVQEDRDNADYVYRVEDLAGLAGRRYAKKRNLIKNCLEEHDCAYEPFTPALLPEVGDMLDRWCTARNCGEDPGLCHEYGAIRDMLERFFEWNLLGGAIRVDGRIEAFAVGEELAPDTAVCHFEKANHQVHGLGQLVNKWFAEHAAGGFSFINREQDLGIPGLRQAKLSYAPHLLVAKFTVWPQAAPQPQPLKPAASCVFHR